MAEARKVSEIQQEFQETCLKLGYAEYQIYQHGRDAALLKERILDLNLEAAASKQLEDAAAKEEEKANG